MSFVDKYLFGIEGEETMWQSTQALWKLLPISSIHAVLAKQVTGSHLMAGGGGQVSSWDLCTRRERALEVWEQSY